ncbi:MAG: polyprenyl synthetase family protein [Candidatus Coatesbacteria bacterium]|nr:polyprenyl synthetase family protein [Candidatus Coatesbacteria bacterium]
MMRTDSSRRAGESPNSASLWDTPMDIRQYLKEKKMLVDGWLSDCLPAPEQYSEKLFEAMRYSLLAGGKRLRPILMLATAELFSDGQDPLLKNFACAIECIHTYSLIHDDLPAMDDDDLRRGRPTCHIQFSEDIAILAGDALLTLAFELMSRPLSSERAPLQIRALNEIATRAGCLGMVGGQTADVISENGAGEEELVNFIHTRKTAALISAPIIAGAILAGATDRELRGMSEFGRRIGLAFQIIDDLLEIHSDAATLGKSVDSDLRNEKITYPGVFGEDKARSVAHKEVGEAFSYLGPYGDRASALAGIARFFLDRVN